MQDEVIERLEVIDREMRTLAGITHKQHVGETSWFVLEAANRWIKEFNEISKANRLEWDVYPLQQGFPESYNKQLRVQVARISAAVFTIKQERSNAVALLHEWEKMGKAVVKQVTGHTEFQSSADLRSKFFDALQKLEIPIE